MNELEKGFFMMESRNFQLDNEWNMIHYPEKPSGFGVFIFGDERHFVDEKSSFWTQNEGKAALIKRLKDEGYTVFYSNLFRKNWGSAEAVQMAKRLYDHILRTEILNPKIHIIAEGMGSLVALKLMTEMSPIIRSAVFINPIISLQNHLDQEKEHRFFYKKLIKELALSYKVDHNHIVEQINHLPETWTDNLCVPILIIHILSGGRAYKQSTLLKKLSVKWQDEKAPISVCYMLPEKKQRMNVQIIKSLKKNEKEL